MMTSSAKQLARQGIENILSPNRSEVLCLLFWINHSSVLPTNYIFQTLGSLLFWTLTSFFPNAVQGIEGAWGGNPSLSYSTEDVGLAAKMPSCLSLRGGIDEWWIGRHVIYRDKPLLHLKSQITTTLKSLWKTWYNWF